MTYHRYLPVTITLLLTLLFLSACASAPTGLPRDDETDVIVYEEPGVTPFGEIWGYLLKGSEGTLKEGMPLSDVGYFGADIDSYGTLSGVPDPAKITSFPGRVHLVVVCDSRSLTHFAIEEGSEVRKRLVADLLAATAGFDGLQIDFELVPAKDGGAFLSFLAELRAGLGDKIFTVALPARTRTLENDVYDYGKIAPLVDRILVMAYDEHWSTSKPGPVASMDWCRSVAAYSLSVIGPEKLIMGLPFYGRTWGDVNTFRAFFHSGIERIRQEQDVTEVTREQGIPTFTYEIPVTVTVYYDDDLSLSLRMEMYRSMGTASVGFWCLGQESETFWSHIELIPEEPNTPATFN
jgi:hypothetical protein